MTTGCGNLYVTINEDDVGIFELFTAMGKAGGCAASQNEAIGRLVSLSLRTGVDAEDVIRQLSGVRCPSPVWKDGEMILSCSDAISRVLKKHISTKQYKEEQQTQAVEAKPAIKPIATPTAPSAASRPKAMLACPDCGGTVEHMEGCMLCPACGYSKCG